MSNWILITMLLVVSGSGLSLTLMLKAIHMELILHRKALEERNRIEATK